MEALIFLDRDGVEWEVSREDDGPQGPILHFRCSALVFWTPVPTPIDPRSLSRPILQRMVDHALDGRTPQPMRRRSGEVPTPQSTRVAT